MKINNETRWRTDDLRRYLKACIEHEGLDPSPGKGWRIRIYYTKRENDVMGYAYYNSRTFEIGVPRRFKRRWSEPTDKPAWTYRVRNESGDVCGGWTTRKDSIPEHAFDVEETRQKRQREKWVEVDELWTRVRQELLKVIIHELGHCKGLKHKDMVDLRSIDTSWFDFENTPIRKKEAAKPKTRAAAARDDLAHAEGRLSDTLEKIKKTESYLKRLKTLRSKWCAEVRRAKQRKLEDL